jgi:hypothetical protein
MIGAMELIEDKLITRPMTPNGPHPTTRSVLIGFLNDI